MPRGRPGNSRWGNTGSRIFHFSDLTPRTREERGLLQQQLADLIGASVMQISRYERGQVLPALETAVALAEALRVSADFLLMDRDEESSREREIQDLRLHQRFLDAEKLTRADREAIILLIDGVLAQRSIEAEIGKRKRA